MARVTVEDCVDKIPNRYELLMVAAQRAKDIASGAPLTLSRDNDKNSVVALREIADETVSIEDLQRSLVLGLQKFVEVEEVQEEELEILAVQKELEALDGEFSEIVIETEMEDSMQIEASDEGDLDLGLDDDISFDDEDGGFDDEGFDEEE